jgi:TonB-dependent SusC/RagA subfamily outer membrane receptor
MAMRITRLLPALCLLASAACASDGILAPEVVPEAASADAAAPVEAAAPAEPAEASAAAAPAPARPVGMIRCSRSPSPRTSEPVYVVDGRVLASGSALGNLLPGDIEKIEVIRGADAASLYGSRAVNGVVLITTRAAARAGS